MQGNRSGTLAAAALAAAALAAQAAETAGPLHRRDLSGGTIVTAEEAPYLVFLRFARGRGYGLCLGVLIARDWVATSAHCTEDAEYKYITVTHISGGRRNGGIAEVSDESRAGWVRLLRHPDYAETPGNYLTFSQIAADITLIKLPNPFPQSKVTTARLPTAAEASTLQKGLTVRTIGWTGEYLQAARADGPISERVHVVGSQATYARTHQPAHVLGRRLNPAHHDPGDSGGPVLLQVGQEWVLIGIHSAVNHRTGTAWSASTYTSRDWIAAATGSAPPVTQPPVSSTPTPSGNITLTVEGQNLEEHICTLQADNGARNTISGNTKIRLNWTVSDRFSTQLRLDCRPL